jgi:5-formyltetrahydrofolate cyclo-ligase
VAGYWACDGELPLNLVIPPLAARGQQFCCR